MRPGSDAPSPADRPHRDEVGVRHRRLAVDGIELHVAEAGDPSARPVVLLHGWPEAWFSWRHQMMRLAEAGYRAVAPDLRGFNRSDKPASGYGLDRLADDVAALIDDLGGSADVVGHDWGGVITWHLAHRHPDRCRSICVLNGPHPGVMDRAMRRPGQLLRSWYVLAFQLPRLPERWLVRRGAAAVPRLLLAATVDRTRFTHSVLDRYRRAMLVPGAARAGLSYYRHGFRDALRSAPRRRLLAQWRRPIERPATLIWAESDPALGGELIEPHRGFAPQLRIERIPGCGHFCQQEKPERVSHLLVAHLARTRAGLDYNEIVPRSPRSQPQGDDSNGR